MSLSILITFQSFYDGGAEMFAIRLANALSEKEGVKVTLLEVEPYYTHEKEQLKFVSKNVDLVHLGRNFLGNFLNKSGIFRGKGLLMRWYKQQKNKQLNRVLINEKINIINSHCWETDVFFSTVPTNARMVFSLHGHYELKRDKMQDFDRLTSRALERANRVVYLTKRHLKTLDYFRIPSLKTNKIFYGLDYPTQTCITHYQPEHEMLELVLIARGIKEKGWKESIDAFEKINDKYPNRVRLNLIGDGEFLDQLKMQYKHPNLIYHGYQNDVREFIMKAHIGLLPTYYVAESLPNAIIEYLFCGKPVITSNIAAIPEMLDAGKDTLAGILIEAQEDAISVNAIAEAIECYLNEPSLVATHSGLALKASRKFTMERCVNEYMNLFNELL